MLLIEQSKINSTAQESMKVLGLGGIEPRPSYILLIISYKNGPTKNLPKKKEKQ